MFQVNDTILYGAQGVFVISGIVEKDFGAGKAKYYALSSVFQSNSNVFVPVNNEKLTSRMRRVMSPQEITELIHAIPDEETVWIADDTERKLKYNEMIASGERKKLVQLIKTLYKEQEQRKAEGKKLHLADELVFKKAENLLYNELALVLKIKPDQVVPFINEQIKLDELKLSK